MKKNSTAIYMIFYLLAVTLVFSVVSVLCHANTVNAYPGPDGIVDLTNLKLEKNVAVISTDAAFIYDRAFYTPEDFQSGNVNEKGERTAGKIPKLGDYGTARFILRLPAGRMYAISSKSAAYAQRIYINGEEYASVGVTGDSPDSVVPKVTRYTEAFRSAGDTTEIILHYSNFVHPDTGSLYTPMLGFTDNISRAEQLRTFQVVTVTGALLTAMLFFFGLFLFFPKNRYLLWFSLACFCIALRGLITGDRALMLLTPDFSWYITIRLEYLSSCGMIIFSALYLNGLFSGVLNKWAIRGFTAFCLSNAVFFFLTPPMIFTRFVWFSLSVTVLFFLYSLFKIFASVIWKKNVMIISESDQILLAAGLFIYLLLAALEIYAHEKAIYLFGMDFAQVGMMIFLFVNLLMLALSFSRTSQRLSTALQSEREMEESNRMLERLDKLRTRFLANITHELKTPLSVIKGYALLAVEDIDEESVDKETRGNLQVISREAQRLADLASELLRVSDETEQESVRERRSLSVEDIFKRASATCRPILAKNRNRLEIHIEGEIPPVYANADMIHQVLLNLTANASRHTHGGVIIFKAETVERYVRITVSDNGKGISSELLPHVLERRVSGGDGDGLGLYVCKEIVEFHGGEISIKSVPGEGTEVQFTLLVENAE